MGAPEARIKSAYRKLSLQHHPDKPGGSAEMFQKIAKAYEALTDPVAAENYRLYGNPDGRQAIEISIGLPSALMNGLPKWLFLGSYVALLCVAIPYLMFWCYKSNSAKGPGGLHPNTFEWLKYCVTPESSVRSLPDAMAGAFEFGPQQPLNAPVDSAEMKRLTAIMQEEGRMPKLVVPDKSAIPPALLTRNLVALYAHLARKHIESTTLAAVQVRGGEERRGKRTLASAVSRRIDV